MPVLRGYIRFGGGGLLPNSLEGEVVEGLFTFEKAVGGGQRLGSGVLELWAAEA